MAANMPPVKFFTIFNAALHFGALTDAPAS
jgi:hypothetical protein